MIWFKLILILVLLPNFSTSVSIGANLDGLRDWSRSLPWVNLIRQARVWGSPSSPWDGNATFDPITGWPKNDFGTVLCSNSVDMGGKYLLYAKGNADISSVVDRAVYITNKTYDASTNTLTAIVNI